MKTKKGRIVIIILLSSILTLNLTRKISKYIAENTINAVYVLVEKENDLALKKAFLKKESLTMEDDLFKVIKNKKDEIIEVIFDIKKSEEVMNSITKQMTNSIQKKINDGYLLYVSVGSMFDSPLLSNLGPKIPVKVDLTDVAMGSVRTKIKEYGINNALVEVYIDIEVKTAPVLLSKHKPKVKKYSFLLSSKIISGKVPDYYGGIINKESALFDLPVIKNIWYND